MLGHNVWMVQWLTFVIAGFWGSVGGLMYVYYNVFLSPHALTLQQSAEILLMAILGGATTLTGPIVGATIITLVKNVVSSYVERWNSLLGAIFILVIIFMPYGLVPGCRVLWRKIKGAASRLRPQRSQPNDRAALAIDGLSKRFGGLPATKNVSLTVMPGERRLIIGPNGAGKTTLFNLITGDLIADAGSIQLFGRRSPRIRAAARAHLGLARTYQIITLFPRRRSLHNVELALLGLAGSLEPVLRARSPARTSMDERARGARRASGSAHRRRGGWPRLLWRAAAASRSPWRWRRSRAAAARRAARRPVAARSAATCSALLEAIPRDVTIVMIEHDMDTALDFAERITLLHYGEVIVEGTRAEVVADPRTREVYLGD